MEDLLRQLLEGQQRMEVRLDKMDERFDRIEVRLDKIEDRLDKVEARLDKMDERFDKMESRLDKMDERLDIMDERLGRVEVQLQENTDMIKALSHRSEVLGAEQQGLLVKTASVEMIEKINDRLDNIEANMATKQDLKKITETQEIHTEWLKKLSAIAMRHDAEIEYLKIS